MVARRDAPSMKGVGNDLWSFRGRAKPAFAPAAIRPHPHRCLASPLPTKASPLRGPQLRASAARPYNPYWGEFSKQRGSGRARVACTLANCEAGKANRGRRGFPRGRLVKSPLGCPSFRVFSWAFKKRHPPEARRGNVRFCSGVLFGPHPHRCLAPLHQTEPAGAGLTFGL